MQTKIGEYTNEMGATHYPAGWHEWGGQFATTDLDRALRIAREVSEGKKPEREAVVTEFSDGVEFKPVQS